MRQELISGWGGCPRIKASLYEIHSKSEISLVLEENQSLTPEAWGAHTEILPWVPRF